MEADCLYRKKQTIPLRRALTLDTIGLKGVTQDSDFLTDLEGQAMETWFRPESLAL